MSLTKFNELHSRAISSLRPVYFFPMVHVGLDVDPSVDHQFTGAWGRNYKIGKIDSGEDDCDNSRGKRLSFKLFYYFKCKLSCGALDVDVTILVPGRSMQPAIYAVGSGRWTGLAHIGISAAIAKSKVAIRAVHLTDGEPRPTDHRSNFTNERARSRTPFTLQSQTTDADNRLRAPALSALYSLLRGLLYMQRSFSRWRDGGPDQLHSVTQTKLPDTHGPIVMARCERGRSRCGGEKCGCIFPPPPSVESMRMIGAGVPAQAAGIGVGMSNCSWLTCELKRGVLRPLDWLSIRQVATVCSVNRIAAIRRDHL